MLVTNVALIALFRLILHEKHAFFVNIFQIYSSFKLFKFAVIYNNSSQDHFVGINLA